MEPRPPEIVDLFMSYIQTIIKTKVKASVFIYTLSFHYVNTYMLIKMCIIIFESIFVEMFSIKVVTQKLKNL